MAEAARQLTGLEAVKTDVMLLNHRSMDLASTRYKYRRRPHRRAETAAYGVIVIS